MELFNDSTRTFSLDGWTLESGDGDVRAALSGTLPPGSYYLLERTSDADVSDVPAELVYTGSLSNGGEDLFLLDPSSAAVDAARFAADGWPAGSGAPGFFSMERVSPSFDGCDRANWRSNDGAMRSGLDAQGNPVSGTPGARNAAYSPFPPAIDGNVSGGGSSGGGVSVDPAANPFSPRDPDPSRRAARIRFDAGSPEAAKVIRLLDVRGEVVRSFSEADGLSGAAEGTVLWDGKDGGGRSLPPGIYAVYFEAVDPGSGARVRGKDRVVLGYPR
jgi:hypothetical protein